ncbi:hypothetical protein ACFQH8_18990 [Halomicroarcula sp. GCM10025710]
MFDIDKTPVEDFPLTDIHIVYASMGDTGTVVDAIAEDAAGIIVAGFLTGGAASPEGPSQSEALERAAENEVPVVMCTRGSYGSIGRERVTDYPGGYGIGGDTLRPQKARILLALGLTETSDPEKLQEFFETY